MMQKSEMVLITNDANKRDLPLGAPVVWPAFRGKAACFHVVRNHKNESRSDDRRSQGVSFPQTNLFPRLAHQKHGF